MGGNNLGVRGVYLADQSRDRFMSNALITVDRGGATCKRGAFRLDDACSLHGTESRLLARRGAPGLLSANDA